MKPSIFIPWIPEYIQIIQNPDLNLCFEKKVRMKQISLCKESCYSKDKKQDLSNPSNAFNDDQIRENALKRFKIVKWTFILKIA